MSLRKIICWFSCVAIISACVEHSKDELQSTTIQVDASEALEYLYELSEKDPENPEVYYQLARIYLDEGQYNQAVKQVGKATAMEQDNAEYHYLMGTAYQKLNKPELALRSLLLAESLGKKNQELYQMVANEYLQIGKPDKAREVVTRLTSMNGSAEAYTLKGEVMLSLGDTALAIENYKKALSIDPEIVKPYIGLADINIARKHEEEAFFYVNKLVDLAPENIDFLIRKGHLLQLTGHLDSAKLIFKNIALQRGNYLDFYRLSNVYYLMRQYDSAQYAAEEAFKMNEKFLNAQLVVARSLDKSGQYAKAIEVYEMIVKADSTFNIAVTELNNLRRKVAYLWRVRQQRQAALDSAKNNPPAAVEKKEIKDTK